MYFFTSDLHLGHRNIISYCNRPFSDEPEMSATLIANWRNLVRPVDSVYILGDLSFHKPNKTIEIVRNLPGYKNLIIGNHDEVFVREYRKSGVFQNIYPYLKLRYENERLVLFHYPIDDWDGKYRGYYHLHGHIHSTAKRTCNASGHIEPKRIHVGVDAWKYTPVSFTQIKELAAT